MDPQDAKPPEDAEAPGSPVVPAAPAPDGPDGRPTRPMPAVMAVVILWVVALGTAGLAALAFLLASDGSLGSTARFGAADAAISLVGAVSLAFAIVCLAASIGVWRSATWGWALALAVGVVGLLAILTAVVSGGGTWELAGGVILFGGLLACLLAPAVRARSGIG